MTLQLIKGREAFIIAYDKGDESAVCDALTEMAQNPAMSFDWFDAAVMSHELGRQLLKEIREATNA